MTDYNHVRDLIRVIKGALDLLDHEDWEQQQAAKTALDELETIAAPNPCEDIAKTIEVANKAHQERLQAVGAMLEQKRSKYIES